MTRQPGSAALVAAVVLVLVGACGQSGREPPAPVPRISKEEFVREGNAICARGNEEIAKVARQPSPDASDEAAATFARVFVPGIRDQISQMRALGYPEGDETVLDDVFNDAEDILRRAELDPRTIDGHAFDDVNARLTAYGLTVCGS